ncbi:MAG: YabP/YqfC family sporulation protein [Clostridia bacterium]|nr:YabP/YqfC family sporulation protein [Clostridia bacterium]
MKIWDEMTSFCADEKSLFAQRCFSVYGKNLVVIQGFKKITAVKNDEVTFVYGNGFLSVVGQNLVVKKVCKGYASVCGDVQQVIF